MVSITADDKGYGDYEVMNEENLQVILNFGE